MADLKRLVNVNIAGCEPLITPEEIKAKIPIPESALDAVRRNRHALQEILDGRDKRLTVRWFFRLCHKSQSRCRLSQNSGPV